MKPASWFMYYAFSRNENSIRNEGKKKRKSMWRIKSIKDFKLNI